jgi:hypothetical protein
MRLPWGFLWHESCLVLLSHEASTPEAATLAAAELSPLNGERHENGLTT